jgi:hypothetical protein
VRVIAAEHVTDDRRALPVRRGRDEPALVRGVEDATVHGLQSVTRVRDGAADDDAHRVVEVARTHLVLDRDGHLLATGIRRRGRRTSRRRGHRRDRRIHVRHRAQYLDRPGPRVKGKRPRFPR